MASKAQAKKDPATTKVETPTAPRQASGETVTVGCKLPLGMFLQLQRQREEIEETPGGTRKRVYWDKYGARYYVAGPEIPRGVRPAGYRVPVIVEGAALTSGIPKDFWEEWAEQNKGAPYLENGFVFAFAKRADAQAHAREIKNLKTGLEPLEIDKQDPRMPRPVNSQVGGIETADEVKDRIAKSRDMQEAEDLESADV